MLVVEHISAAVADDKWRVCVGSCWWSQLWQRRSMVCWYLSTALCHRRAHGQQRTSSHVSDLIVTNNAIHRDLVAHQLDFSCSFCLALFVCKLFFSVKLFHCPLPPSRLCGLTNCICCGALNIGTQYCESHASKRPKTASESCLHHSHSFTWNLLSRRSCLICAVLDFLVYFWYF